MTLKLRWGQLEVALSSRGRLGVRVGGVVRWPFWIVARSLVVARCELCVLAVGWRCKERSRAEVDRVAS